MPFVNLSNLQDQITSKTDYFELRLRSVCICSFSIHVCKLMEGAWNQRPRGRKVKVSKEHYNFILWNKVYTVKANSLIPKEEPLTSYILIEYVALLLLYFAYNGMKHFCPLVYPSICFAMAIPTVPTPVMKVGVTPNMTPMRPHRASTPTAPCPTASVLSMVLLYQVREYDKC